MPTYQEQAMVKAWPTLKGKYLQNHEDVIFLDPESSNVENPGLLCLQGYTAAAAGAGLSEASQTARRGLGIAQPTFSAQLPQPTASVQGYNKQQKVTHPQPHRAIYQGRPVLVKEVKLAAPLVYPLPEEFPTDPKLLDRLLRLHEDCTAASLAEPALTKVCGWYFPDRTKLDEIFVLETRKISEKDCALLNRTLISFDDIQFDTNPKQPFFERKVPVRDPQHPAPLPVPQKGEDFDADSRALYHATWNRVPVVVKRVSFQRKFAAAAEEQDCPLPDGFTPYCNFSLRQQRLLREISIGMSLPRHLNLCQVYGWTAECLSNNSNSGAPNKDEDGFYIVMERYDKSLHSQLDDLVKFYGDSLPPIKEGGVLGWEQLLRVATDVAHGLKKLDSMDAGWEVSPNGPGGDTGRKWHLQKDFVVHRDIKLGNLFLSLEKHANPEPPKAEPKSPAQVTANEPAAPGPNAPPPATAIVTPPRPAPIRTVLIGDFGSARVHHKGVLPYVSSHATVNIGTLTYQPPEAIDPDAFANLDGKDERLTSKLDIFSFGVVLWRLIHHPETVTSKNTTKYKTDYLFQEAVATGKFVLECDKDIPEKLVSLITRCCSFLPKDRPDADQILSELSVLEKELVQQKPAAARKVHFDSNAPVQLSTGSHPIGVSEVASNY